MVILKILGYWLIGAVLLIATIMIAYSTIALLKMPSTEQLNKVREWLLYAVTQAEKDLGSGTGKIKLRYVYDKFLIKFPYLIQVISFNEFETLVDQALIQFRDLLATNQSLQNYVNKQEVKENGNKN